MQRERHRRRNTGARGGHGNRAPNPDETANKTEGADLRRESGVQAVGSQLWPPGRGSTGDKNRFPVAVGDKRSHCRLPSGSWVISVRWPEARGAALYGYQEGGESSALTL